MRAMLKFAGGALFAFFAVAAAAAPPPPPPPPPEGTPSEIDGYPILSVRHHYYAWITARMAQARTEVLRSAPLPPELASAFGGRRGPRIRVVNDERAGEIFGYELQIAELCIYSSPQTCRWLARRAVVRDGAAAEFLRANFDARRAVSYLQERGVTPAEVATTFRASSYGLADPMSDPFAHVEIQQVTDTECNGVLSAVEVSEQQAARLELTSAYDEARPPPPPPPHVCLAEVTFPRWYARARADGSSQSYAEITLSGRGDRRVSSIIQAITEPLRSCGQFG